MNEVRHERIGELFLEAARLRPEVRRAFLDSRCEDDPSIASEVEDLLRHRDAPGVAVNTGAIDVGAVFDAALSGSEKEREQFLGSALSSVARYRIVRLLGEGGMGTVYLAEQDHPRRTVALKVMRPTVGNAERLRKRFHLEAEVLGRLEHPGIARIYDAGSATVTTPDGSATVPYFAMEYVDGPNLLEYTTTQNLGTRDRVRLVARVAQAVGAAHRLGIVHRDIKPANVLVDSAGQPKVLDFGVARATDSDVAVTTMQTDVGQLIGTLPYMSPEQVSGDPTKIDVRCDVYALGALAYELLVGRPLIDARGKTVPEVARIIRDEDPSRLSSVDRVFRGDLDTIVAKALEKDPGRRYQSASEFAVDVEHYLAHEPIVARPATALYQWSKFARRNRVLVGGIAATFVALIGGLVGMAILYFQAREQEHNATQQGIIAKQQAEIARAAQERADHRFNEVRKLAHAFVYDVHDKIVDLPGSTEARKTIVTIGLSYFDSLAAEAGDDVDLASDVSEAYLKIGQAQGYVSRANLGDREGARESYNKAIEIRQRLADNDPANEKLELSCARARNQLAILDFSQGRYDDALAGFERITSIRQQALDRDPNDPAKQRELGIGLQWLGNTHGGMASAAGQAKDVERKTAEYTKALEYFKRYASIMETLASPADRKSMRDRSVSLEKVGDALGNLDRREEALTYFRQSFEIRDQLFKDNPENAEAKTDLLVASGKIGAQLMALKKFDEATPYLKRSMELNLQSVEADPNDVFARTNLVVSESRLSELAIQRFDAAKESGGNTAGLLDEAQSWAQSALDRLEALDREGKLEEGKKFWKEEMRKLVDEAAKRR